MKSSCRRNEHQPVPGTWNVGNGFLVAFALLVCAAASGARAQSPAPLSIPNLDLQQNGSVLASVTLADGSFLVGGTFTSFNSVHRSNIAKFKPDGTLDPTWSATVTGFPASVNSIAVDGASGDIYIGGQFSEVNGVARGNLAKLHADGSLDLVWDAGVDVGPSGFPGEGVFALALDGEGDLFVGGTIYGGLAKVSTSGSGVFDPSWSFVSDGNVFALAYDGTSLFVGGNFEHIYVASVDNPRNFLAKLSTTGALDATWNPQADANIEWSNPDVDSVQAMALDGSGNLYIGGSFNSLGGDPGPPPPQPCATVCPGHYYLGVARVSTSGTGDPDATWAVGPPNGGGGVAAYSILLDGAGNLYLGGPSVHRRPTSGSGAVDATWHPSTDAAVHTLALAQGGGLYLGGVFLNAGGVRHFGFAKTGTTGAGTISASTPDAEVRGQVFALAPLADGSMIVGGNFLKAGALARKNLVRMNADGTVDATWNVSADATVLSLAADGAGSVYVGGAFANIGGQARASVAKVSATGTGTVNATWNPSVASGSNVYALLLDGSDLYLGGDFLQVGAQVLNGGLARVSTSGAGAVDTGWIPFATDATNDYGYVYVLVRDGVYLYAGGGIAEGDGGNLTNLVRYATAGDGSPDTGWNPSPNYVLFGSNQVNALYADGAGSLFVGGIFQTIGGLSRNNIAKVSTSGAGAADANWAPEADQQVLALLPDGNGNIYVGGGFFNVGGQARRCIAKLSATGTGAADANWNSSADDYVRILVRGSVNGDVYAGGDFIDTGAEWKYGFAAFATDVVFSNGFGSP